MNRQKYLIKNVGILTISNFASKILCFFLVPLYTSILSTEEYGTIDLLTTTISIFIPLLTLNIVDGVMRFAMDKTYDKRDVFCVGKIFSLIGIVIILFFLVLNHAFSFSYIIKKYELFVFFSYFLGTCNNLVTQFAKGIEKVKEIGISGVIGTIVTISFNILFLVILKWGLTGYLIAMICSSFIQLFYMFFALKIWNYNKFTINPVGIIKEMIVYSVPLLATTIGWWLNSAADRYTVTFMISVSATGIISVAYKIPQIINTLESIFIQAWQISAIKEYGESDTKVFYGKTFAIINLLMCVACSGLIILDRPLAKFLYSKDFYIAWKFVPFLLLSSVFNCASGLLGPILSAKKDSKSLMNSAIVGAFVNVFMNIILVYFIGLQGATLATAISSCAIYYVRKRAVGKDIEIEGYSIILLTWALLGFQCFAESFFNNYIVEVVIVVVLLIININLIKELWNIGKNIFLSLKN